MLDSTDELIKRIIKKLPIKTVQKLPIRPREIKRTQHDILENPPTDYIEQLILEVRYRTLNNTLTEP